MSNKSSVRYIYTISILYILVGMRQQDYQSAMKLLDKSISINPPSSQPKLNLAWILGEAQNQKKDALALYEEVLLKEPENTNALLNAGYLSYQLKKYERTKNHLRHYLNLMPNNSESTNIQNLLKSLQ